MRGHFMSSSLSLSRSLARTIRDFTDDYALYANSGMDGRAAPRRNSPIAPSPCRVGSLIPYIPTYPSRALVYGVCVHKYKGWVDVLSTKNDAVRGWAFFFFGANAV